MGDVKLSITVPGLSQLGARFEHAAALQVPKVIHDSLERVGASVVQEAKGKVHSRTGRLAASILLTSSGPLAWKVGSRLKYANAVHWGTGPRTGRRGPHNIRRNPFLFDAVTGHQQAATAAASDAIAALAAELESASV